MVEKERDLLDKKGTIESEIKWLDQTLSFLIFNASSPNDPVSQAVVTILRKKKDNMTNIVGYYDSYTSTQIKL